MIRTSLGLVQPAPRPECYSYALMQCIERGLNDYPGCALIRGELAEEPNGALHEHLLALKTCEGDIPRYEQAMSLYPSCYTEQLDHCLKSSDPASDPMPGCAEIYDAYDMDPDAVDSMPWCPEPKPESPPWLMLGGAALGSIVLGFFLGKMV